MIQQSGPEEGTSESDSREHASAISWWLLEEDPLFRKASQNHLYQLFLLRNSYRRSSRTLGAFLKLGMILGLSAAAGYMLGHYFDWYAAFAAVVAVFTAGLVSNFGRQPHTGRMPASVTQLFPMADEPAEVLRDIYLTGSLRGESVLLAMYRESSSTMVVGAAILTFLLIGWAPLYLYLAHLGPGRLRVTAPLLSLSSAWLAWEVFWHMYLLSCWIFLEILQLHVERWQGTACNRRSRWVFAVLCTSLLAIYCFFVWALGGIWQSVWSQLTATVLIAAAAGLLLRPLRQVFREAVSALACDILRDAVPALEAFISREILQDEEPPGTHS